MESPIIEALYQDNLEIVKYLIIDKKEITPKIMFVRDFDPTKKPDNVTISSFLKEQDYTRNLKNEILRNEILKYLNKDKTL